MKEQFPYLAAAHPQLVYLDSAATAHKPQRVIDALVRFYSDEYATVHRAIYGSSLHATALYNRTRQIAHRFVNAERPEEILFTRGTTDGINLVARSWADAFLSPGDEIALSPMEHHANLIPWQLASQRTGAILRFAPRNTEGVPSFEEVIGPRTKLVALSHASNVTGVLLPVRQISDLARRYGALVVVDGAQAAPHLPIDVQALGCDFYAFSGHKCYGPTGVGILYGRYERLLEMPPLQGGGDMAGQVDLAASTYQPPPLKFEAGTPPIASIVALGEALQFLQEAPPLDPALASSLHQAICAIDGATLLGPQSPHGRSPLFTFTIDGCHPLDVATLLDLQHVAIRSGHLCAQTALRSYGLDSALRASLGLYNTPTDIDRFASALKETVAQLRNLSE